MDKIVFMSRWHISETWRLLILICKGFLSWTFGTASFRLNWTSLIFSQMETGYLQESWEMQEVFKNRPGYFPLSFFKSLVLSTYITCRNYSTGENIGNYSIVRVSLDWSRTGACGPDPLVCTCSLFLYVNVFSVHHDNCIAPWLQCEHVCAVSFYSCLFQILYTGVV